jgi:hypothetical protein
LIGAIIKALKTILKNPLLLLPALIMPAVIFGLLFVLQEPIFNLLIDVLFLERIPESTMLAFPIHLLAMYPIELAAVAVMVLASSIISIAVGFIYAKYANGIEAKNASLSGSLNAVLENKNSILALAGFIFIVALFVLGVGWLLLVASATIPAILVVVMLLFALLSYLFVKLAFSVQAMAIGNPNAKDALSKSWTFTNKRFWQTLGFLILITIVYSVVIAIGDFIDISLSVINEDLGTIAFVVFWAIGVSFSNLAMAFYFIEKDIAKAV